jgi:hypothetical protein
LQFAASSSAIRLAETSAFALELTTPRRELRRVDAFTTKFRPLHSWRSRVYCFEHPKLLSETAIELIEQRRAAEKTPTKLVKPPAYRQRKSIG